MPKWSTLGRLAKKTSLLCTFSSLMYAFLTKDNSFNNIFVQRDVQVKVILQRSFI